MVCTSRFKETCVRAYSPGIASSQGRAKRRASNRTSEAPKVPSSKSVQCLDTPPVPRYALETNERYSGCSGRLLGTNGFSFPSSGVPIPFVPSNGPSLGPCIEGHAQPPRQSYPVYRTMTSTSLPSSSPSALAGMRIRPSAFTKLKIAPDLPTIGEARHTLSRCINVTRT